MTNSPPPSTSAFPAPKVALVTAAPALESAIAGLADRKTAWVQVPIAQRLQYLEDCLTRLASVAAAWAEAGCRAKGIDPASSLAGEEWTTGPVCTMLGIKALIHSLQAKGQPQPQRMQTRPDGQTVATVFPASWSDRLLWLGFRGEVWLQPGQPATQGWAYRQSTSEGQVALVLGAGNVAAIAPLDVLYKLFAENQVVLLKLNPVNDYLGEFWLTVLAPLIRDGFVAIAKGDASVGQFLCQHPHIDTIHITGATQTHTAIVWGATPAAPAERQALTKPITSELGCVTPIVVVPGQWTEAELRFQARHVASMVAHNASFNCVAGKVLVLAQDWPQREPFLALVQQTLAQTPPRQAYYPGAQARYQAFLDRYPQAQPLGDRTEAVVPWTLIPNVPPQAGEYALSTEAFCGVLATVSLPGSNATDFLAAAVPFVNECVWGNLSCVVLVDPRTQQQEPASLDRAIAALQYGAIGVNVWTGAMFSLPALTWGAFPGNSLADIQSGRGVVHNAYLFDHPQKSVLFAPFQIRPTPIWFADHRNLRQIARHYVEFLVRPRWQTFAQVVFAALKG